MNKRISLFRYIDLQYIAGRGIFYLERGTIIPKDMEWIYGINLD